MVSEPVRVNRSGEEGEAPTESALRTAIADACRSLVGLGLNHGLTGNISARCGENMLITPSATEPDDLRPELIARVPLATLSAQAGPPATWAGALAPSSEWRFHRDILRARPELGAVVHSHAPYATALSLLHEPLPAVHYMIAIFGGPEVRCVPYAAFGSQDLSDAAVAGLADRTAVLLANHGAIAVGASLDEALWRARELEELARLYLIARAAGEPKILSAQDVDQAIRSFAAYRRSRARET